MLGPLWSGLWAGVMGVGGVCRGCQGPEDRSGGVVGVSPCHPSETDADLTKWGPVRGASREGLGL